jgi:PAS domain S-box-containing protein
MGISEENQGTHNHRLDLRRRAEDALRGKPVEVTDLPPEDFQYLLHELQVHQAELSIQNEELRRVQLDLETARDLYSDLFNFAPAGYCTLSRKDTILEANQTLADLLGVKREELIRQPLSHFVDYADQDEYYLHRQRAFEDQQRQISNIRMVKGSGGGEKIVIQMESMIAHEDENKLWVMLSDITEQQRIEKEAQEAAALRELRKRMNDQREQERHQVARDLHDGPMQGLIALTYAIHEIRLDYPDPALATRLESIQTDLKEQIAALRTYAMEIRPPMLSKFGLEQTIREHAKIFQKKHPGISIQLEMHQTGALLAETTSLALFRIYQEALTNIVKHGQRPDLQICVSLDKDENLARLEIQDNGPGFKMPEQWIDLVREGHLGLVGMRERAEALGGQLEIQSNPREGTRVVAIIPLGPIRKVE